MPFAFKIQPPSPSADAFPVYNAILAGAATPAYTESEAGA